MVHLVKVSGSGQSWLMCGLKIQAVTVLGMWALSSGLTSGCNMGATSVSRHHWQCRQAGIELSGRKRPSWEAPSSTPLYISLPPLGAREVGETHLGI